MVFVKGSARIALVKVGLKKGLTRVVKKKNARSIAMGIEGENPGLGSSKTLNLGEGFCIKKKGNTRISLALLRNSEMFGNLVKVMQNSSVKKKKRKSNG